jgi:hypothetical protein
MCEVMMRDGILESQADARWLKTVREGAFDNCQAFVSGLTEVALWYAYEIARCPSSADRDIKVDRDGWLVIALNDDANPPGWYHYKRRAGSDDEARALVREKFGDVVEVPLRAMLSERAVSA